MKLNVEDVKLHVNINNRGGGRTIRCTIFWAPTRWLCWLDGEEAPDDKPTTSDLTQTPDSRHDDVLEGEGAFGAYESTRTPDFRRCRLGGEGALDLSGPTNIYLFLF